MFTGLKYEKISLINKYKSRNLPINYKNRVYKISSNIYTFQIITTKNKKIAKTNKNRNESC